MIQTWRFPIVLSLSVVFGMPALHAMMTSPEQLFRSGLAYLGALGLSWLGVNSVFNLMDHYATHNQQLQAQDEAAETARELLELREREAARTHDATGERQMATGEREMATSGARSAGAGRADEALPGAVI